MLFDRSPGQRAVSPRICRSREDASSLFEPLSVGHLAVWLPRTAILRPARLAQERSPSVAGKTQHSLGRHIWRLRELPVHVLHVPFRLHLAHRLVYHWEVTRLILSIVLEVKVQRYSSSCSHLRGVSLFDEQWADDPKIWSRNAGCPRLVDLDHNYRVGQKK